jgi:hypothetical protein
MKSFNCNKYRLLFCRFHRGSMVLIDKFGCHSQEFSTCLKYAVFFIKDLSKNKAPLRKEVLWIFLVCLLVICRQRNFLFAPYFGHLS